LVSQLAAHSTPSATDPASFDGVWGLVLVVNWPAPHSLKESYEAFATKLAAIDPKSLYVYPLRALHCTVSTFVNFKQHTLKTDSQKECVLRAFCSALAQAFGPSATSPAHATTAFHLVMSRPALSDAAVFFLYEDPTESIAAIRRLIEDEVFPRVRAELGEELFASLVAKSPNIVHSTVARFKEPPDDPSRLAAGLSALVEAAGTQWKPVRMEIDKVTLAVECLPYMHIPASPASVAFEHQLPKS